MSKTQAWRTISFGATLTVVIFQPVSADTTNIPEITIYGNASDFGSAVIAPELTNSPQGDTAQLLQKMPGANVNSNGTLTGIAQYRGMYGDRVNKLIDGIKISSGGPNAMDAPLSYIPRAQLESLEVVRGLAPVSSGNETIGGTLSARSQVSQFADSDDFQFNGLMWGGRAIDRRQCRSFRPISSGQSKSSYAFIGQF